MVEYDSILNSVFSSLSDPTRRDILRRVSKSELSISEIAKPYHMSFAAVAKHVAILEAAMLVSKHYAGKQHLVTAVPQTIEIAQEHLEQYQKNWEARFSTLDQLLQINK